MSAAFTVFSPQQWQVLQALRCYRFLTVDQMLRLGISRNAKSLRDKTLFALRHHKCIHSEKIGAFLPDIHHLTRHGQKILAELEGVESEAAPADKRVPFSPVFAPHRFAQVDFQIGLRQWVEQRGDADILLEIQDFMTDPNSGTRKPTSATELKIPDSSKAVIPDGTFAVELNSGKSVVYLVEIHRSTQTKAVTAQLERYFDVIKHRTIQQKYALQVHPIICSVHHQTTVLNSVKKRLNDNPEFEPFKRNFVFHTLDDLTTKFTGGWHFADNTSAHPFPNPQGNEH